jgi:hypothetical protein
MGSDDQRPKHFAATGAMVALAARREDELTE